MRKDRKVMPPANKYPQVHRGYFPDQVPIDEFQTKDIMVSSDGHTKLQTYSTLPTTPPRAQLFIFPGLFECVQRNGVVGTVFARHGYACHAIDYAGFGGSEGYRGLILNYNVIIADCVQFVRAKKAEHPELPCFLFGQSLGGATAIHLGLQFAPNEISGLLLVCPAVKSDIKWFLQKISALIGFFFPRVGIVEAMDADSCSDNLAVAEILEQEGTLNHHGKMLGGTGAALVREVNFLQQNLHRITHPFRVIQAEHDYAVNPQGAKDLFDKAATPANLKEYQLLTGEWHDIVHCQHHVRYLESMVEFADRQMAAGGRV